MDRPAIETDGVRMRVRRVTSALICSRPQNLIATAPAAVPPPKQSKQLMRRHLPNRINFSRLGAHFLMVLRHFKVDDVIAAPLRSRGKARQLILRVTTSLIGVGLQCRNITWPNRATSNVRLEGYENSVVKSKE